MLITFRRRSLFSTHRLGREWSANLSPPFSFFPSENEKDFFLSFFLSSSFSLSLLPLSFSAHVSSESTGVYQFVHPRADPNVAIVSCRHICTMNVTVLLKKRERERVREREKYSRLLLLLLRQSPFSLRWTTMISRSTTYTSVLYMYIQVNKYIGVEARNNTRIYMNTRTYTHTVSNGTTKSMKTKPRYTGN